MRLLSIGDQVEPGLYEFHSRFNRVVNFTNGRYITALVGEDVGPGPLNIVISDLSALKTPRFAPSLHVDSDELAFADQHLSFTAAERYRSEFRLHNWNHDRFASNLSCFGKMLLESTPARSLAFLLAERRNEDFQPGFKGVFVSRISGGVRQIFRGNLLRGIRALKGCGLGLTPSGDDFIAGLLVGVNLLQRLLRRDLRAVSDVIFKTAMGDNIFSNTSLDLARRGLLFGRMKNLIAALVQKGENAVRDAAARLLAVGCTSGADMGTGFYLTVLHGAAVIPRWIEVVSGSAAFQPCFALTTARMKLRRC